MEDLSSFFHRYADAYLRFDPTVMEEFFHFPCLINDLGGVHAIADAAALRQYHIPFFAELKNADLAMSKAMLTDQQSALPGGARALVSFRFGNRDNNLIFDCDYSFALLRHDSHWKIVFAQLGEIRYSDLF
ncbi:MAG: hypothetical protein ABID63_05055 [Pseudomonadota bacterium]